MLSAHMRISPLPEPIAICPPSVVAEAVKSTLPVYDLNSLSTSFFPANLGSTRNIELCVEPIKVCCCVVGANLLSGKKLRRLTVSPIFHSSMTRPVVRSSR